MAVRVPVVFLLLVFFSSFSISPAAAKNNKKKQQLPDVVLKAQRVAVVIHPDAVESLTDPRANRTAQDEVERAISKWHRFDLVMDSSTADLIIVVRKGQPAGPMISNSPMDHRSVVLQPSEGPANAGVRIGGQQGRPPDLTNPGLGPQDSRPQLGTQIGGSQDMLEVYLGGVDYPLDSSPLWRFTAKNALNGPAVPAVEEFRKAIEESEKQRTQKP